MNEQRYMISDASKKLEVEPHVLRYWEEELKMDIQRNEMGHRYYSEQDLRVLESVKELKQNGFQLKAIKLLMPELKTTKGAKLEELLSRKDELNLKAEQEEESVGAKGEKKNQTEHTEDPDAAMAVLETAEVVDGEVSEERLDQFQMIMNKIIANALLDNNGLLGQAISEHVTEKILKEMDYQFRVREEQEEQRFKRLDESIRSRQQARLEAAAAMEQPKKKMRRRHKKFFLR